MILFFNSKQLMWYKILNTNLKQHRFQYKLGLNIDTVKFNPSGSCEEGGLYFTNAENLHKFFDCGTLIADLEIPEDASVYKDPDGDKWKADKLIVKSICKIEDHPLLQNPNWCLAAIRANGFNIKYIKNQTEELCLEAVKQQGYALQFIKNQTEEICLTAVKQNGYALCFVEEQTDEVCLMAVRTIGRALEYVKKQTYKICQAAVKRDGMALEFVINQNSDIRNIAFHNNHDSVKFIKN